MKSKSSRILPIGAAVVAIILASGAVYSLWTDAPSADRETQKVASATPVPGFPADDPPPLWAFTMDPPESAHLAKRDDDDELRRVPGSTISLSRAQTQDLFNVADWHPDSHPPAPHIVKHGRRPRPAACAFCHMLNGMGTPPNAALAGMSEAYIIEQMTAYRSGERLTVMPEMVAFKGMVGTAKATSDADIAQAAAYYASLKPRKWIDVVEVDTVPKTVVKSYALLRDPAGGTEPIGNRIIELPKDERSYDLRDDGIGFIAYVPKGSVARGRQLVENSDPAIACASCHGDKLQGMGDVPPLAGRGPSSLTRQLYNFQYGRRTGVKADLMKPVVQNLNAADRVAMVAYISSMDP